MQIRAVLKSLLAGLARLSSPLARLYARPAYFSPLPPDWQPRRVALVSCNWIGDNLWAMQVLPALRERWPQAAFTVFTKPASVPLWRTLCAEDDIRPTPEVISDRRRENASWQMLRAAARRHAGERFDLVIDLTGNRYSALFCFLLRPARSLGLGKPDNELRSLYSCQAGEGKDFTREHLACLPWMTVQPLLHTLPQQPYYPSAPLPEYAPEKICADFGLSPGVQLAVFSPGAGWAEKEWPLTFFAQTARWLENKGYTIVITDQPAGRDRCEEFASLLSHPEQAVLVTEPDIRPVLSLLCMARIMIGNNSGLGHLAAAFGCLTVMVFTGATDPETGRALGKRAFTLAPHDGQLPQPQELLSILEKNLPEAGGNATE